MKPRLVDRIVQKDGRVKERIEPDLQAEVMKPETAEQLTAMMARVVEEGTGTAGALAGIRVAGKTGTAEVGANREFTQPWFIAFAPGRRSADRDRRDRGAHHGAGRHGGGADREVGARGTARRRRRMTEVAGQHARRRPLSNPAPDRLRRHGGRLLRGGQPPRPPGRDQGAAPALRAGPGVRGALPPRGEVGRRPQPSRTWWASSTAASTRAPTTSRWSTSPAARSRTS